MRRSLLQQFGPQLGRRGVLIGVSNVLISRGKCNYEEPGGGHAVAVFWLRNLCISLQCSAISCNHVHLELGSVTMLDLMSTEIVPRRSIGLWLSGSCRWLKWCTHWLIPMLLSSQDWEGWPGTMSSSLNQRDSALPHQAIVSCPVLQFSGIPLRAKCLCVCERQNFCITTLVLLRLGLAGVCVCAKPSELIGGDPIPIPLVLQFNEYTNSPNR